MNDKPHRAQNPSDAQREADQIIAAIEGGQATNHLSQSEEESRLLGDAIRKSAATNLPAPSSDLRELISDTVDTAMPTVAPQKPVKQTAPQSNRWMIAGTTVAALMVIGAIGYLASVPKPFGVALSGGVKVGELNTEALKDPDALGTELPQTEPPEKFDSSPKFGQQREVPNVERTGDKGKREYAKDPRVAAELSISNARLPEQDAEVAELKQQNRELANGMVAEGERADRGIRTDESKLKKRSVLDRRVQNIDRQDGQVRGQSMSGGGGGMQLSEGNNNDLGIFRGSVGGVNAKPAAPTTGESQSGSVESSTWSEYGRNTRYRLAQNNVEEDERDIGSSFGIGDNQGNSAREGASMNPSEGKTRRREGRGFGGGLGGGGGGFGGGGRYQGYTAEQYDAIHENSFKPTKGQGALSTFSIDVDTASYANMRRFLSRGQRVPPNSVRIEEFVNYFQYDYPQPEGDQPFSVNMEMATCPWNEQHKLLRVGLKGKDVHRDERPAANIVFLIDVSGSMRSQDKLPLLKSGFQLMVNALNENDSVSIVTYAGSSRVVLEPTSGDQKQKINAAIDALQSGGSTNGSAGIEMAYELAQRNFIEEGNNKVILATDGDLNVGVTSDTELVKLITNKAAEGVFLTVLGFGTGNLKDSKMEKIADNGNGVYAYIDGVREAHKVLVEGMSGSLVTIAKDVKIQIEFNPAEVKAYRLIGYENRILAAKDFDDDTKDAGEIGAGHTVTALYELVTTDAPDAAVNVPQGLKYQQPKEQPLDDGEFSEDADSGELLTLALRYKQPDAQESKKIEFTLANEDNTFSTASGDFKFASSVAAFGMILRGSEYRGNATPQWVQQIASESIGNDASGYRAEFIDLVRRFHSAR